MWQPIETAPKGAKVLLGYRNRLDKWRTVTGRYYEDRTLESDHEEETGFAPAGWYEETETHDEMFPTDEYPTHWMPLPEPPEQGEKAGNTEASG